MKIELLGHYFPYCQFCVHDGKCELRHHEFLGLPSQGKVDATPYPGHEAVWWGLSVFQSNAVRGTCAGRIRMIDSVYFPLGCECGTAIDGGDCQKFSPNEQGRERKELAERVVKERGIPLSEVQPEDLPPLDPSYASAMDIYYPDLPRT